MVAPDRNTTDVLAVDLGADRVWRCRLDVAGRLTPRPPAVVADPGTGPRHLLRHPDGTLLLVGELAVVTGGVWPRHLAFIGDHLCVANEWSHSVTALRVDAETGLPASHGGATSLPSPTCLLRWMPRIAMG